MSAFAAWGLTLLGLAVIATVAEMLLPQGKMRSVLRSVIASIAVLVMVTPLPQLFKRGFDFDFSADSIATDTEYLDYVDGKRAQTLAAAAEKYLGENGYDGIDVEVRMDGLKIKSVAAKFVDTGIIQNGAHIDKNEITRLLAEYFGIEKEAVMAYG